MDSAYLVNNQTIKKITAKQKKLIWGISTKADGSMKTSSNRTDKQTLNNRKKFFSKLKIDLTDTVLARSVHGNKVKVASWNDAGRVINQVDGLITKAKGLVLIVTVADCLPIYIFDNKAMVIGLLHAGWRGLEKNIIENAIITMVKKFKVKPANLQVRIGPYIKACHYQVRRNLINFFVGYPKAITIKNNQYFLDLAIIAKQKLVDLGIDKANIKVSDECTFCTDKKYFSFRRDKPKVLKTMIAYIGMR